MYENNPEKPTKELLDQIRSASMQKVASPYLSNVAMALPTFSALLVRLSNEATKTADKNIKLSNQNIKMQKRLLRITIVILAFTIFMFAAQMLYSFGFFNIFREKENLPSQTNNTTTHSDKTKNNNINNNIIHNNSK